MKRLSRFHKILITVGVVAASGGVSLGITSLVSANNSTVASGDVSVASDGSTATADTKVKHVARHGLHDDAMAELLGMTVDELHEALHSGKSLAMIAEEKNVALSKVTDLLIAEFIANVDEMVTKTRPTRGEDGPHGEMGPRGGRHGGGHRGFSSHETPRELGELEGSGTAFVQA